MNTIKTNLTKVLTLALVALTVLFSFAINPGVAQAEGYCCGGDVTYLGFDQKNPPEMECIIEPAPGYEYYKAYLSNVSNDFAAVKDDANGFIPIPPLSVVEVGVPPYGVDVFRMAGGDGPVYFNCVK